MATYAPDARLAIAESGKPSLWAAEIAPDLSVGEWGIYEPSVNWPVDWSKYAACYRFTSRYRMVLPAPQGKATAVLPLALNQPPGKYVVTVVDAVSGAKADTEFCVAAGHVTADVSR